MATLEKLASFNLSMSQKPLEMTAQQIPAGDVLLGNNKRFPADCSTRDFDQKIQDCMFKSVPFNKWCIVYHSSCSQEKNTVMNNLKLALGQFKMDCKPPAMFEIQGRADDWNAWNRVISDKIEPNAHGIDAVIFILVGRKNDGKCYKQIKSKFYQSCPVPSQCVLQSTISKGKNVRSIVNKILMQIVAKMSGIPYKISDIPIEDKPTMVCGVSLLRCNGAQNIISVTGTMDRHFTKLNSKLEFTDMPTCDKLQPIFKSLFQTFGSQNGGRFP